MKSSDISLLQSWDTVSCWQLVACWQMICAGEGAQVTGLFQMYRARSSPLSAVRLSRLIYLSLLTNSVLQRPCTACWCHWPNCLALCNNSLLACP